MFRLRIARYTNEQLSTLLLEPGQLALNTTLTQVVIGDGQQVGGLTVGITEDAINAIIEGRFQDLNIDDVNALREALAGYADSDALALLPARLDGLVEVTFFDGFVASLEGRPSQAQVDSLVEVIDNKASTTTTKPLLDAAVNREDLFQNGLIRRDRLPDNIDEVREFASKAAFPATGTKGFIYVAMDTNTIFRWSGSTYVALASPELLVISTDRETTDLVNQDTAVSPHGLNLITQLLGFNGLAAGSWELDSGLMEFFKGLTGKVTALRAYPRAVYHPAGAVVQDKMYCYGGYTNSTGISNVYEYNFANDTYRELAAGPGVRYQHTMRVWRDKIYCYGGLSGSSNATPLGTLYEFDPAKGTWTLLATSLNRARHWMEIIDDVIYIGSGYGQAVAGGSSAVVINDLRAYNLITKTWSTKTAPPANSQGQGAASTKVGKKIYVSGGWPRITSNAGNRILQCYDTETDKWTTLAPPPASSYYHNLDAVGNNFLYSVGGNNGAGSYAGYLWEYDIRKNSWKAFPNMSKIRAGSAAGVHGNKLYHLGGMSQSPQFGTCVVIT